MAALRWLIDEKKNSKTRYAQMRIVSMMRYLDSSKRSPKLIFFLTCTKRTNIRISRRRNSDPTTIPAILFLRSSAFSLTLNLIAKVREMAADESSIR